MTSRHDRTVHASRKAGGNAARRHARGERVQAPDPLAGSLLARKAATAWHAGFAEVHDAATGAESKAASGYDLTPQSGMISLDIPDGVIDPVPGGVTDHHVTVVYLGPNVTDDDFDAACSRARQAASRIPGPLTASLSGIGSFPPSDGGKKPVYIPASIPGGDRLRGDLEDLSASEHPQWSPHVTTHYAEADDPLPVPQSPKSVTFTHLSVHRGDDVRRFPFGGMSAASKGASGMLETKVGPHGWEHNWHFVGIPGTGDAVHHPSHGKGVVTAVTDKHVAVRFSSGANRNFEHVAPKPGQAGGFVKRGDHSAEHGDSSAAAHAATPHLARAAKARELAKAIRASGEDAQMEGRQGGSASSALEQAAAHFGAGDHVAGVRAANDARHALHDEADKASFEAGSHANAAGRLRSYDPQGAAESAARSGTAASRADMLRQHAGRVSAITMETPARPAPEAARAAKPGAEFSPGYLRGEGATDSDVAELARRYMVMHGKAPSAAEVAKIKRAKPPGKTATAMSRDEGLAKARSIHEADKAAGGGHLPPLALLGNEKHADGSVSARAVDHEGRDYGVKLGADKTVTVTHKGKSLTEPAGSNPTQKARELAGKLTAPPGKTGAGDSQKEERLAGHAAQARKLAAAVRGSSYSNATTGTNGGVRADVPVADRLDQAAAHFDAGREDDGIRALDESRSALSGVESRAGSRARSARGTGRQTEASQDYKHVRAMGSSIDQLRQDAARGQSADRASAAKAGRRPAAVEQARAMHEADPGSLPLVLHASSRGEGGGTTAQAVDHLGRDYTVHVGDDRSVSVTHNGKTASAPADADTHPMDTAHELAAQLTAMPPAAAKPPADDFWADEQPKAPPAPPAPKPKFDQGAMFSEPDKLGTAPMFGDKFGTSDITKPNTDAVAPAGSHAATARGLAENVRLEGGLTKFQKEEAETRLNAAARHLDAGNHAEAVAELDAAGHATEMRGGGVIKGSTAAKARDLAAQIRTEHGIAPKAPEKPVKWSDIGGLAGGGSYAFGTLNGHRMSVDYGKNGKPHRVSVDRVPVGEHADVNAAKKMAEDHARSLPRIEAKENPAALEVKDLATAITSASGREGAVRNHLAVAEAAIEGGDVKTAYGALDLARRYALGEFGDNPDRPVTLEDKSEAWRPIIRIRDSIRSAV